MRPTWDQTWMAVADAVALRSRCVRSQVGAVVIDPMNRIGAVGYNGPPRGMTMAGPCSHWCPRATEGGEAAYYDNCWSSHAEMNCLLQANARDVAGGTLYVTRVPCYTCAKVIANSGVARIVCRVAPEDWERNPEQSLQVLRHSGLDVVRVS